MNISLNTRQSIIDVRQLPVEEKIRGSIVLGIILMGFASFWGGFPTFHLIKSAIKGPFEVEMLLGLIFTVIGIAVFIAGFNQFFIRGLIKITSNSVHYERADLFKKVKWDELIQAYEGILKRSEYHSGSKNSPSYTLYILELYHKDKKKIIRLYESKSKSGFRGLWESFSRALSVPALEKSGNSIVKRNPEDLDKSIQDLVHENKIVIEDIDLNNPPEGINVKSENDVIAITTSKHGLSPVGAVILLILPFIFIYIGFFVDSVPVELGVFGIIFELIFIAAAIWSLYFKQQLRITFDYVQMMYISKWKQINGKMIKRTDIEQVSVGGNAQFSKLGRYIVIQSDTAKMYFGMNLPPKSLHWLEQCILRCLS